MARGHGDLLYVHTDLMTIDTSFLEWPSQNQDESVLRSRTRPSGICILNSNALDLCRRSLRLQISLVFLVACIAYSYTLGDLLRSSRDFYRKLAHSEIHH